MHKGLVTTLLAEPLQVADHNKITNKERAEAKEEVAEAVKAALIISKVDKRRYGRLKEQLAKKKIAGYGPVPGYFGEGNKDPWELSSCMEQPL